MNKFLKILLAGAAIAAVAATVIYIKGKITAEKLRAELKKRNRDSAIIKAINQSNNIVTLESLFDDTTYEVHGDEISDELYEGEKIYV